ncbi:Major facilitator superfamily protein [Prunus dulcis]|uniref:Major facilitator superfamily protein n=1 Tax=Prunus dulcis TaxID=3755 RepID=A0A4Y1RK41_PRUDU|nr:Major facilitator superfamily protein [Prunus dulcis]
MRAVSSSLFRASFGSLLVYSTADFLGVHFALHIGPGLESLVDRMENLYYPLLLPSNINVVDYYA